MKINDTEMKATDFREAFKFPLKGDYGMVFTSEGERAFDWPNKYSYPTRFPLSRDMREVFISAINGENKVSIGIDLKLSYDPVEIMIYADVEGEKRELISIRGWGMLTGIGGLNLDDDTAAKLQDDFANHIINQINLSTL